MNNLLNNLKVDSLQQVIICRNFQKEIIGIYKSVDDAADDFLIDTQEIFDAIESKKQLLGSVSQLILYGPDIEPNIYHLMF